MIAITIGTEMKQFILFNYMIELNGRIARLVLEPGTPWEEAFQAIDTIKEEMIILKAEAEKKQQDEKQDEPILEVSA
jgi:hypothetical protein